MGNKLPFWRLAQPGFVTLSSLTISVDIDDFQLETLFRYTCLLPVACVHLFLLILAGLPMTYTTIRPFVGAGALALTYSLCLTR